MNKKIILIASFLGMLCVIAGAFGAHLLKKQISSNDLEIWKTAVDYQFYHTFALFFISTLSRFTKIFIKAAWLFFTIGILLFSGSLYLLATKSLFTNLNISLISPLTPIGGVFLILGWLVLFLAALKDK